jgi:hypothetical protein
MKIVDFTCEWADGKTTPEEVFGEIWNGSNFWTPFVPSGPYITPPMQPDNANGFRGKGDPVETARTDAWTRAPKCYTYQHNLNNPYPIPGVTQGKLWMGRP